jgi:hypothetical protein
MFNSDKLLFYFVGEFWDKLKNALLVTVVVVWTIASIAFGVWVGMIVYSALIAAASGVLIAGFWGTFVAIAIILCTSPTMGIILQDFLACFYCWRIIGCAIAAALEN